MSNMNKKPIVREHDIIKTYSEKQQESSKGYLNVVKLKNKRLTCSQVSKLLNIKIDRVHRWLCKGVKPYPIHATEKCKIRNWLPLYPSSKLARLVGLNIGDGSIQTVLSHTFFSAKSKDMMDQLNEFIFKHFGIKGSVIKAGFDRSEHLLEIGDTAFTRLLYCAGCPKGEKTKQVFNVPRWIMNPEYYGCDNEESRKIQLAFLQGLNDSETTKFSLKNSNSYTMQEIRFEIYTYRFPDQFKFIEQLQQLYTRFSIKIDLFHYWREDSKCWRIGFRIKELINMGNFLLDVGFFFNKDRLIKSKEIYLEVCKKRLENIESCILAMQMIDEGKSYGNVSKTLGIPTSTIFGWKSVGRRPLHFNKKNELEELFKRFSP